MAAGVGGDGVESASVAEGWKSRAFSRCFNRGKSRARHAEAQCGFDGGRKSAGGNALLQSQLRRSGHGQSRSRGVAGKFSEGGRNRKRSGVGRYVGTV